MLSFGDFAGNKWDLEDEETSLVPTGTSSSPCININSRTSINDGVGLFFDWSEKIFSSTNNI